MAEKDSELERAVAGVVERFGGPFELKTGVGWRKAIESFGGVKVHLTMYGEPIDKALPKIRKQAKGGPIMLIVGASKVPGEVYGHSDFNVAVASQPHSEVAALAVFLDRWGRGAWAGRKFKGGRVAISPSPRGKVVLPVGGIEEE